MGSPVPPASPDGLLFVYSDPGPVPAAEFHDWYDNEHGPARLTVPGISAGYRFRALDGQAPPWLAYYEMRSGALDSPEYKALAASASAREKSIMSSLAVLDRRVYELISDSGPDPAEGPPPAVLAVSLSVPPAMEDDLAAWYTDEHIPMLLAVPGWRRVRRYRLTDGTAPAYLSLHEVASESVFDEPGYRAAVTTPWRNRIVAAAIGRERRMFGLHRSFG
ncbi:MAG TPA: hypothetical protein VKV38_15795 [Trebonia sp.]|nr:hypothetical protein [Trebonia sp.]